MSLGESYAEFQNWLTATIGPPLKRLHAPLDDFLSSLSLTTAKFTTIAFFVLAGLWVLSLSKKFVYLGAPDQARWRDLRIWAILVLVPYIVVYLWLG